MTGNPTTQGMRQLAEARRAAASAVDLIAAGMDTTTDTARPARRAERPRVRTAVRTRRTGHRHTGR